MVGHHSVAYMTNNLAQPELSRQFILDNVMKFILQ
jgi:hypothetical protein